jgi:hypothetical protein
MTAMWILFKEKDLYETCWPSARKGLGQYWPRLYDKSFPFCTYAEIVSFVTAQETALSTIFYQMKILISKRGTQILS